MVSLHKLIPITTKDNWREIDRRQIVGCNNQFTTMSYHNQSTTISYDNQSTTISYDKIEDLHCVYNILILSTSYDINIITS